MTPVGQRLSEDLTTNVSLAQDSAIPGELVADVVRGVLDEHRKDAHREPFATLLLDARHRLERLERARSFNSIK